MNKMETNHANTLIPTLLTLPFEIREQLYELLAIDGNTFEGSHSSLGVLLRVNKQIRREILHEALIRKYRTTTATDAFNARDIIRAFPAWWFQETVDELVIPLRCSPAFCYNYTKRTIYLHCLVSRIDVLDLRFKLKLVHVVLSYQAFSQDLAKLFDDVHQFCTERMVTWPACVVSYNLQPISGTSPVQQEIWMTFDLEKARQMVSCSVPTSMNSSGQHPDMSNRKSTRKPQLIVSIASHLSWCLY